MLHYKHAERGVLFLSNIFEHLLILFLRLHHRLAFFTGCARCGCVYLVALLFKVSDQLSNPLLLLPMSELTPLRANPLDRLDVFPAVQVHGTNLTLSFFEGFLVCLKRRPVTEVVSCFGHCKRILCDGCQFVHHCFEFGGFTFTGLCVRW